MKLATGCRANTTIPKNVRHADTVAKGGRHAEIVHKRFACVLASPQWRTPHFQGTLYFNFHGYEERASIVKLHDPDQGVVVAEKCCGHCFKIWPEELMDVKEDYLQFCAEEMNPRYESFDFQDLMNTTFGLVPGGASPGTHRLAEASTRCRAFSTLAMSSPKANYPHLLSLSLVSLEVMTLTVAMTFMPSPKTNRPHLLSLFS